MLIIRRTIKLLFTSCSAIMSKKLKLLKMPKNALNVLLKSLTQKSHAQIQKVFSEQIQLRQSFFAFFYFERGRIQNTTISGPSSARQRNVIKMTFCWRADDGSTLNAGLAAL